MNQDTPDRPAVIQTKTGKVYLRASRVDAVIAGGGAGLGKCAVFLSNSANALALEASADTVAAALWPDLALPSSPIAAISAGGGILKGDA